MLIQLTDASGKQEDASGKVLFVAGFDGLVDMAGGDGDGTGDGASGDHSLKAGGIGATTTEDFRLPFDFMAGGGRFHKFNHAVVADDRRIHELDRGTLAEGGAAFLWGGAGYIVGDGGIQSKAEISLDLEGGSLGTAEANFLLDGENRVKVVGGFAFGFFQLAESFDEDKDRGPVVERFGVDAVAELEKCGVAGDEITNGDDFNDLLLGHAGIDEIIGDFDGLIFLFRSHEMDGFRAHDADNVAAAMDDDAMGGEGFRVEATDGIEANEALVVDVGDDEADFVDVGGGHGFFGGGLAFFQGDDVAHVVDADFVGETFELGEDELADFFFRAGSTGCFTNAG